MRKSAQLFWETVEHHWQPQSEDEKQRVVHSVLLNFRKRLPPMDASRITDLLPSDIASLSAEPGIAISEDYGHSEVQNTNMMQFIAKVSEEANISLATAQVATTAVFKAIRSQLPPREINVVHRELPSGLKEVWGEKVSVEQEQEEAGND